MKDEYNLNILYEKKALQTVCKLCPIECAFKEDGDVGRCMVRGMENNIPTILDKGEISSISIDPIEKKPLYHFHPSSHILSVGFNGCNLHCSFCQNYKISQEKSETKFISSEDLIQMALKFKKDNGSIGLAFTYNEPIVSFEYIYECAKLCKENNIATILITNGYINEKPLSIILPYIDAFNIDIKGDDFMYKKYLHAKDNALNVVLNTVKLAKKYSHVEVTTLIVKETCDWQIVVENIASCIKDIDDKIPYHISAYHPAYKHFASATTKEEIKDLALIAMKYLKYVYEGNTDTKSETKCECENILISRRSYNVHALGIKDKKCSKCKRDITDIIVL